MKTWDCKGNRRNLKNFIWSEVNQTEENKQTNKQTNKQKTKHFFSLVCGRIFRSENINGRIQRMEVSLGDNTEQNVTKQSSSNINKTWRKKL